MKFFVKENSICCLSKEFICLFELENLPENILQELVLKKLQGIDVYHQVSKQYYISANGNYSIEDWSNRHYLLFRGRGNEELSDFSVVLTPEREEIYNFSLTSNNTFAIRVPKERT